MADEKAKVNWGLVANWALVAIAAWHFVISPQINKGQDNEAKPKPVPVQTISSVVSASRAKLAASQAATFEQAAKQVEAGTVSTDAELWKVLSDGMKENREKSYADIDGYIQDNLPRDKEKLKPESAKFLRDFAKAFGKGK